MCFEEVAVFMLETRVRYSSSGVLQCVSACVQKGIATYMAEVPSM